MRTELAQIPKSHTPREFQVSEAQTRFQQQLIRCWPELLLALLVLASALQHLRRPVFLEDAYITLQSARNFAAGHGLIFQPGEQVLSTTAPGYAILLGWLTYAGVDTEIAARLVSCAGLLLACVCLVLQSARAGLPSAGLCASLVLCLFPEVYGTWGNESLLLLGIFGLVWVLSERNRPISCATAVVLGSIVRPDFALAGIVTGAFFLQRSRRQFLIYAGTGLILSLPWLAYLFHSFGSVVPNTLGVKMQQGLDIRTGGTTGGLAVWVSFPQGLRRWLRLFIYNPVPGLFACIGLVLCCGARWARLPVAWCAAHLAAYSLLGVPGVYFWYYYPLWLLIPLALGATLSALVHHLPDESRLPGAAIGAGPALLLGYSLFVAMNYHGIADKDRFRDKYAVHSAIAAEVRKRVPPSESVLMDEVGQISFQSGCRAIDRYGLIHRLSDRVMYIDPLKTLQHYCPRYLIDNGVFSQDPAFREKVGSGVLRIDTVDRNGAPLVYKQIAGSTGTRHALALLERAN